MTTIKTLSSTSRSSTSANAKTWHEYNNAIYFHPEYTSNIEDELIDFIINSNIK